MNMNREAVDAALSLAGNMPLTDDDKKYKNLVYVACKNLYLPTLFSSLAEIDWRCARKYAKLHETLRYTMRESGKYYYEIPADCVRPLQVDDNGEDFRNDTDFIITDWPAETLYYVFHNRRLRNLERVELAREAADFDRLPYFGASPDAEDGRNPAFGVRISPGEPPEADDEAFEPYRESPAPKDIPPDPVFVSARTMPRERVPPREEDDFPDWEYTPYDTDFWQYFSYRLAARLVPKLRMDDGAAQRARALEDLAREKGEEAVERSRAAASNPSQPVRLWAERAGITGGEKPGGYAAPYKNSAGGLRYL